MAIAAPLDPCRERPAGLRIGQRQTFGKRDRQVIGPASPLLLPFVARQRSHDVADERGIGGGVGVDHLHLVEPQAQPKAGAEHKSHLVRCTGGAKHRRALEAGKQGVLGHGRISGQHLHLDPRRVPQGVEQFLFEPWRIEIIGHEQPTERLGQCACAGVLHREFQLAGDVDQIHLPQPRGIAIHEQGQVVGLVGCAARYAQAPRHLSSGKAGRPERFQAVQHPLGEPLKRATGAGERTELIAMLDQQLLHGNEPGPSRRQRERFPRERLGDDVVGEGRQRRDVEVGGRMARPRQGLDPLVPDAARRRHEPGGNEPGRRLAGRGDRLDEPARLRRLTARQAARDHRELTPFRNRHLQPVPVRGGGGATRCLLP